MLRRYALTLFLCLAFGWAAAQDPAPAPAPEGVDAATEPQSDEKSQQALQQLKQALKKAQSVSYNSTLRMKAEAGEQKQDITINYDVATQKPNKLHVDAKGAEMGEISFISTGEEFYTYVPAIKKYTLQDAPDTLGGLLRGGVALPDDPALGFMLSFAEEDPLSSLTEGAAAKYVGTETLEGVEAHHIRFEEPQMNWHLWIRTGDQPVPVQIKPEFPPMPDTKIDMTVAFSNWNLAPDIPDDRFAFTPPEGVTEMAMDESAEEEEGAPHRLVGQPAPTFSLDLLQGGKMDLAQHKGKDIVILDFWATWCGPCRQAMPVIDKVAGQFKDKNVVLYAVNLRETPDEVKKFLEDQKLDVTVALDTKGSVADQYGVEGIPQTVIIGKDGTVQALHEGFGPGFENDLTDELNTLAAGKSLVEDNTKASAPEEAPKP